MFGFRHLTGVFIILLALLSGVSTAQDIATEAVAIVVLDVFESEEPVEVPVSHTCEDTEQYDPAANECVPFEGDEGDNNIPNCTFDMEGHDSYQYGGDSFARFYSSALTPFQDPHGRLIFAEYQSFLRDLGATVKPVPDQDFDMFQEWQLPDGPSIYLIGVNLLVNETPYETNEIAERVLEIANDRRLYGIDLPEEIENVIFSMSFGLMPCNRLLELTLDDYLSEIEDPEYGDIRGLFHDLLDASRQDDGEVSGSELIQILKRPEFAVLHANIVAQYGWPELGDVLSNLYPSGQIPAFLNRDPLFNINFSETGGERDIVAIASSGNDGREFPYAPALAPSVLSVSAEYPGVDVCHQMLNATQNRNLTSNWGEVQKLGFYNCLPGTSFAVPRMGIEMAIYLLMGGSPNCNTTNPPLAYIPDWTVEPRPTVDGVDKTREEASQQFCFEFNERLEVFNTR